MSNKIENIEELRKKILQTGQDLEAEVLARPLGAEMINAYGKALNSVKVELEYCKLRKEEPHIPFMKYKKPE